MLGQGGNSAQQWAGLARGETLDPMSMFVNPQQEASFDLQNQLLKLGTLQNRFNVDAAPDPMLAGLGQWGATQEGMIMGLLSSVLGSAGKGAMMGA